VGYGQEVDVAQSRAAGFRVHLVKPVAPAKLISTIAEVASRAD
jgi:CheY-like chemotaxis protein